MDGYVKVRIRDDVRERVAEIVNQTNEWLRSTPRSEKITYKRFLGFLWKYDVQCTAPYKIQQFLCISSPEHHVYTNRWFSMIKELHLFMSGTEWVYMGNQMKAVYDWVFEEVSTVTYD